MDTLERIAKRLHRTRTDPLFQRAWAALQAEGWRRDDLTTPGVSAKCLAEFRERLTAQTGRRSPGRTPAWIKAAFAASDEAAEEASIDPAVQAFRADVLHGHLLAPRTVPNWLWARAGKFEGLDSLLAYQGESNVVGLPVAGNADVERLHTIVRRLVKVHRWPEDAATTFVLTGGTPLRWPIHARATLTETGATTVHITVEAWVPATAVTAAFQRARREFFSRAPRAPRRLSARQQALAAFVTTQGDVSARTRMDAWNQAHRNWRYRDPRNFDRDSRRAAAAVARLK
jgi:hypothetical protein